MGKWNRRWVSRKKYYNDRPPPSPPTYYDTEFKLRGSWKNTELPWEERFCVSVGIPWQKVVTAKKYMYCHNSIFKWNDSAGEEAFSIAKRRFWAEINNIPSIAPKPDPNIYIDEINWNSKIDPLQVSDLDKEYFNPDEAEKFDRIVHHTEDKNPGSVDNPWECSRSKGELKEKVNGWGKWDNSNNDRINNPWENRNAQCDEPSNVNAWNFMRQDALESIRVSQNLDNNRRNTWDGNGESFGSLDEKEWRNIGNSSCGWSQRASEAQKSSAGNSWESCGGGGPPKNRQWRDCNDNAFCRDKWENRSSNKIQSRMDGNYGSGRPSYGDFRKRQGSQQFTSRYKSSRYEGDEPVRVNQWRMQRT